MPENTAGAVMLHRRVAPLGHIADAVEEVKVRRWIEPLQKRVAALAAVSSTRRRPPHNRPFAKRRPYVVHLLLAERGHVRVLPPPEGVAALPQVVGLEAVDGVGEPLVAAERVRGVPVARDLRADHLDQRPSAAVRHHVAEDLEGSPFENTMQFKSDAFTYSTSTTMIVNMSVYRSHIIPRYTGNQK